MAHEENHHICITGDFINYVRVATAFAVIKSKPSDISLRDHFQKICESYMGKDVQWKEKALKLESQMLVLKQELIQSRIAKKEEMNCDKSDCGEESQSIYPTPPFSEDTTDADLEQSKTLNKHTAFLKSIINLQSMTNSRVLVELNTDDVCILDSTIKTVKETLNTFEKWICCQYLSSNLSSKVVDSAIGLVAELLEKSSDKWKELHSEVCSCVLSCTENIVTFVMNSSSSLDINFQHHLQRNLMNFSKISYLRKDLVTIFIKNICGYSEILRSIKHEENTCLKPITFENMYVIFESVEKMLELELRQDSTIPVDECKNLYLNLENSLLYIAETFPLFAHYVWNLNSLLQELIT